MPAQRSPPRGNNRPAFTPASMQDPLSCSDTSLDAEHRREEAGNPPGQGPPVKAPFVGDRHRPYYAQQNNPMPYHSRRQQQSRPKVTVDDDSFISDQRLINGIVNSAVAEFGSANILRADGNNFRRWSKDIEMMAGNHLNDNDYYNGPCVRPRTEPAARRILLALVDHSMKSELYNCDSSHLIMDKIKARFNNVSKARQLTKWHELRSIKVDMTTNPASVATQMKAIIDELGDMGVMLHYNDILPLIIHENIQQGTPLRLEFDRRIDANFARGGNGNLSFKQTWRILSEAMSQVQAVSRLDDQNQDIQFMSSGAAPREDLTTRDSSMCSLPDNIQVNAAHPPIKRSCFRCKSNGHLVGQCTAPDPNIHRAPPGNSLDSRQAGPYHSQAPFNAYYPIIAPSGSTLAYYPPRQHRCQGPTCRKLTIEPLSTWDYQPPSQNQSLKHHHPQPPLTQPTTTKTTTMIDVKNMEPSSSKPSSKSPATEKLKPPKK